MAAYSLTNTVSVTPISAFSDNYIWCLHDDNYAVVVDPGDAQPVLDFCQTHQLSLIGILITHHHHDHTGGIKNLIATVGELPVIGPKNDKISGVTKRVSAGATVGFPKLGLTFNVFEVPGHTLDHIAFYGHNAVFCGDTLFSAGCGRMFEGTPEQFSRSLDKLSCLPDNTAVFCTHEYTLANLAFALHVTPNNSDLVDYKKWADSQREADQPTLPSDIKTQNAINPFLRTHTDEVKLAVEAHHQSQYASRVEVFGALRSWKDEF